jgi:hypothetical protein
MQRRDAVLPTEILSMTVHQAMQLVTFVAQAAQVAANEAAGCGCAGQVVDSHTGAVG